MNRKEIEQRITDAVTAQLREGKVPWRKPWTCEGYLPTSLQTGKAYRGMNRLLLSMVGGQYARPLWVTYKQAQFLGGNVRKGEKGMPIIYYSMLDSIDKETLLPKRVPLLRLSTVFNVEQCEGVTIPAKLWHKREPVAVSDGIQALLDKYTSKPEIYHRAGDEAFYSPMLDSITVPNLEQYERAEDYAYTLAHELTHSTSHESRLNRKADGFAPFGSANYALEELVADIGAQMTLSELGVSIDTINSASYVAGWLSALSNDTSLILKASAQAQKACDYMLGIKHETDVAETVEEEALTV